MIFLDTHVVLWMMAFPRELSSRARIAIEGARRTHSVLAMAGVTLYELSYGLSRNGMKVSAGLTEVLGEIERFLTPIAINPQIALIAAQLPAPFPRDPFDRIIAATAIANRAPLITADGLIRGSGAVETIW